MLSVLCPLPALRVLPTLPVLPTLFLSPAVGGDKQRKRLSVKREMIGGKRERWEVAAGCRTLEAEREAQQQPIIRKLSTQSHAALEESQRGENCSCHFKSRINNLPKT